jgi:hypothetical protein
MSSLDLLHELQSAVENAGHVMPRMVRRVT